ncbi:uncharacterized protein LOC135216861 [Macrobrachium nipponense]|uniref:uncharacterized protein LOC135216861 n=1 Tax=Macrobrachium nipponense TaxID=159736 RepID=UPI0030C81A0B
MWTSGIFGLLLALSAGAAPPSSAKSDGVVQQNATLSADDPQEQTDENESVGYSVALRKCLCDTDEAWNGTACEKSDSESMIPDVLGMGSFDGFHNVTIGEVCPGKSVDIDVEQYLRHSSDLYLSDAGEIVVSLYTYENYCFEDYKLPGEPVKVIARICMEPPTVPSCCPLGHSLDLHGNCSPTSSSYDFSPAVMVQNQSLAWPSETGISETNISCTDMEKLSILKLNHEEVMMHINANAGTHSSWMPSLYIDGVAFKGNFCISVQEGSEKTPVYLAKFCIRDLEKDHQRQCLGQTCIRKCCLENEYFDQFCQLYSDNVTKLPQPLFYDPEHLEPASEPENLAFVFGGPFCDETYLLLPDENGENEFKILQTGYLYSASLPEHYPPTKYCVESHLGDEINMAVVCMQQDPCHELQRSLYPFLVIISAGFLGVTLFVYVCIPDMHAKVHGKCVSSHVSALLIAFITLFIVHQSSRNVNTFCCKFMASVMQLSFLAAFFWLNVMCFDIWWTLRSMRLGPEPSEQSRLRFRLYSLYSWGCPFVIAVISVIIDSLPEDIEVIRPRFGETTCWFDSNVGSESIWVYFYGIILVIIIVNILFFCHVMYILLAQQRDSTLEKTRKQNRERLCLYVKLFIVMGITWLAEVVSWQQGSCKFWIATDVINCLQGVFIFLMYICKKNDLQRVRDRWDAVVRHLKEEVRSRNLWPTITQACSENEPGPGGNTSRSSSSSAENKTKSTVVSLGSSQAKFPSEVSAEKSTSSVSPEPTKEEEQLRDVTPSGNGTEASRSEGEPPQKQDTSAPPPDDDGSEGKVSEVQEVEECNDTSDNAIPHEESHSGETVNPPEVSIDVNTPEVSIDMETHEDEEDEGTCAGLDVKYYLNDGYDTDAKSSRDGASSENVGDTELKEIHRNV